MGVRSTYYINSDVAKKIILERINYASNRSLANMLLELCEYKNFIVTDDTNDTINIPAVNNLKDFLENETVLDDGTIEVEY